MRTVRSCSGLSHTSTQKKRAWAGNLNQRHRISPARTLCLWWNCCWLSIAFVLCFGDIVRSNPTSGKARQRTKATVLVQFLDQKTTPPPAVYSYLTLDPGGMVLTLNGRFVTEKNYREFYGPEKGKKVSTHHIILRVEKPEKTNSLHVLNVIENLQKCVGPKVRILLYVEFYKLKNRDPGE